MSFKIQMMLVLGLTICSHSFSQKKGADVKAQSSVESTLMSSSVNKPFPQTQIAAKISVGEKEFSFIGTYVIYAGVPKTVIGKLMLQPNGEYLVSWETDPGKKASGTYEFFPKAKGLAWTGGFFLSKRFKGEIKGTENGVLRIVLSSSTYAEKVD
ncbi:MAG: hypothetical protein ACK5B8_00885 [Bacteroidota bacterium]|jgi:hypothetical protein